MSGTNSATFRQKCDSFYLVKNIHLRSCFESKRKESDKNKHLMKFRFLDLYREPLSHSSYKTFDVPKHDMIQYMCYIAHPCITT